MAERARLLDMGEVDALRALALRQALAGSAARGGEPAVLLARATTAAVLLGEEAAELDPAAGRRLAALGLPCLRVAGAVEPTFVAEGSLLVSFVLPPGRAAALLPDGAEERAGWLRRLGAAAAAAPADGGESPGTIAVRVERAAGADLLTLLVSWEPAPELRELATGWGAEPWASGAPPAAVAEALLGALEEAAGLELVPSMPMPGELDAVHDWEQRLAAAASLAGAAPGGA